LGKFVRHVSQPLRNVSTDRRIILSIAVEIQMNNCNNLKENFTFGSEGKIRFCCTICVNFLLILIVEFEIDLSRILRQGKPIPTCFGPVTDVFQLKIY
jgi:hypothetical protein